jgi:hypothetical protein
MCHFANIDAVNLVTQVLVSDQNFIESVDNAGVGNTVDKQ